AAAVAGATSVQAAFQTAKDCVQTLGGIGFTWEHDASLYLRRAQTLRVLLGSTASWRRRVARLTLDGVRRELRVELPPEAERIRVEVRAELEPAKALDGKERLGYLADRGYTSPHLPEPWGKGADAVSQLVIAEEMRSAGLRAHDMIIGNWVVPTLIAHGSAAQHERFLPASLRGDIRWCQLFSEPGAGSDLAALGTRAEKVEGGWKITGQKVWTSMAREADWGILLARTDPSVPKHKGLSYFLLDMGSPGIDIRPLRELTGDTLFNEVFLDGVFIPDDLLVAAPGDGWKLALTTLANERVSLSNDSSLGSGGEALLKLATDADDERLTTLGGILCDAQSSSLFGLRTTLRSLAGGQPGAESSIGKLIGVEHIQQVWETAVDWIGPEALTGEGRGGMDDPTWMFLNSRNMSIAGGTTDVQLNIIGERLLGLPRDPQAAS
ncbi:acyl-CoA dehydrogenase family protein, partial [Actinomadura luteofluorescens]